MSAYPHVFSQLKLGAVELRNRFYLSPHGSPQFAQGHPTADFARYFEKRAASGVGLLIQSIPALPVVPGRACPYFEETIPSFAVVAELVHKHGAKLIGEVHYLAVGGLGAWEPLSSVRPALGPSAGSTWGGLCGVHELSTSEIRGILDAFRRSIRNLMTAGYDGVEMHATHSALGEAFTSPLYNHRLDHYGGELENRLRLLVEMLEVARAELGSERALGVRFNCDELTEGGYRDDLARDALRRLAATGLLDYVDLDIALEPAQFELGMPPMLLAPHYYKPYVERVREAAGSLPVISVMSRVTSIADAESMLAEGVVDAIGAARGLIAEPKLLQNAERGMESKSRVCIACNWCIKLTNRGGFGCAINPSSGRERRWDEDAMTLAPTSRKVVVVGAGPGGMEAARIAALRGHAVVLFEQSGSVGGQLNLWARLPGREVVGTTVAWYESALADLPIDLRLGTAASVDDVLRESPEAVIVATGARYAADGTSGFRPLPIPGSDHPYVYTPEQILDEGVRPAGRVVILDDEGQHTGLGIAELLSGTGSEVVFVTRWSGVTNALTNQDTAPATARLKRAAAEVVCDSFVREINIDAVTLYDIYTNVERVLDKVDAVVLATMRRPDVRLAQSLEGHVEQLFSIGDALSPRQLGEATFEAHRFARMIGEANAPQTFLEAFLAPIPADVWGRPAMVLHE